MEIEWVQLGAAIGHRGGAATSTAQSALELILGHDAIDAAVDVVVALDPGWELAESVLVYLRSPRALQRARLIYQSASGERKRLAVWLIKNLAHPDALAWIPEFLADPDVMEAGIDVLDQLIFAPVADPESAEVQSLLTQAESHSSEYVRQKVAYIRRYLRDDEAISALQQEYYDRHGIPGFPPDGIS